MGEVIYFSHINGVLMKLFIFILILGTVVGLELLIFGVVRTEYALYLYEGDISTLGALILAVVLLLCVPFIGDVAYKEMIQEMK